MVLLGFRQLLGDEFAGILQPDLDGKRGELLLEALPGLRHVAVLADPIVDKPPHLEDLIASAKARSIELSVFSAKTPEEIVPALEAAKTSGVGAVNVLATRLFCQNRRLVFERARELRLPAIYQFPDMAEQGGLIGYGPRISDTFRTLGRQLAKILRGTNPICPFWIPDRYITRSIYYALYGCQLRI